MNEPSSNPVTEGERRALLANVARSCCNALLYPTIANDETRMMLDVLARAILDDGFADANRAALQSYVEQVRSRTKRLDGGGTR